MSSTSPSPNSSPTVDLSPSANSPPSNSSPPSPARDSPPPLPNPSASTPPPTNSSSPPPSNSTTPPPTNSTTPPPDSPPPSIGVTPPPTNSEPPKPPPSNGTQPPSLPPPSPPPPSSPPPVTPPTPIAPPPTNNSPPAPPPNNPPSTPLPSPPSPPGAPPTSPPPVIPPRPSPPAPPGQSPPAPGLQPPSANLPTPQPSVPGSSPSPPQTNTTRPGNPTSPSGPSTPTENPPADANPSRTNTSSGRLPAGGVIAIVLVGMLALSLVVFASWFVHRRKKRRSGSDHGNTPSPFVPSQNSDSIVPRAQNAAISSASQSPYHSAQQNGSSSTTNPASTGDPGGLSNSKPLFTYEELVRATNGFSEDNLLGEGGFGCVYKGNLADGREVAVKQLKIGGGQGEREFRAEVEIISRIHHRHLVSIVGYCISDFQRLLVYDYVPNNTLYHHLHGNVPVMTWPTRFKVAAGAARGIAYLHEDCTPRIIHRDIKSSNILLDNKFEAKVADFGLAKLALELEVHTHISTRVMGTFGYMAPEYATSGKLTEKSDVFSFGVVLLELITGRKPVDSSQQLGDESLVEWARPLLTQALETESFENLVDPRLQNEYVTIEMFRLTEAAAACVRHSASKRPKMSQVVRAIDSISEVQDLTNGMRPGDSRIVDSREQSAEIRLFQRMAFGSHEYTTEDFSSSQSSKSGL